MIVWRLARRDHDGAAVRVAGKTWYVRGRARAHRGDVVGTTFASNFNKVKTSTNCLFGETNVVSGHGRADRRPSAHDDDASPIPCPGVVPASSFFAPYCRRRHLFSLCVPFLTWLTPCSRLQFSAVINLCGIINLNWYQFELREWSLVVLALAAAGAAPSSTPDRYPDSPLRS